MSTSRNKDQFKFQNSAFEFKFRLIFLLVDMMRKEAYKQGTSSICNELLENRKYLANRNCDFING